jgi:toxin ParE1/3/4
MEQLEGYRVSRLAQADIEGKYDYTIKNWSISQADAYYAEIIAACEGLVSGTSIGHSSAIEGYQAVSIGTRSIFYRIDDYTLLIVRVLHQAMDVARHFEP